MFRGTEGDGTHRPVLCLRRTRYTATETGGAEGSPMSPGPGRRARGRRPRAPSPTLCPGHYSQLQSTLVESGPCLLLTPYRAKLAGMMRALPGDHSPHKTSRGWTQVSVLPSAPTQHGSRVKQVRQKPPYLHLPHTTGRSPGTDVPTLCSNQLRHHCQNPQKSRGK